MNDPKTRTLDVPGAVLQYDVREAAAGSPAAPVLVMVGSPMGAAGFGSLAGHFADRTVVTYDPRGVERSVVTDDSTENVPEDHAEDISRIITALGAGPVDLLGSSGGAVNSLALVTRHPEQVRTLVAHEPPAFAPLPDRAAALAASRAVAEAYQQDGLGAGMARFIVLAGHRGEVTEEYLAAPAPDPAGFGLPTGDDGSRNDPLLGRNMISCTHYEYDYDALQAASTRIVVGVGAESAGELAHRAGAALAERLGRQPVVFPSHHGGFLGGEYGQNGDPEAFAATLRQVLDGPA